MATPMVKLKNHTNEIEIFKFQNLINKQVKGKNYHLPEAHPVANKQAKINRNDVVWKEKSIKVRKERMHYGGEQIAQDAYGIFVK
ncbi:hypothetical protein T4B_8958 [Trichinella pseudospiralis]|uniref:Uncharacterized protein n=1 Tax=Trichinella pseudospiralis TaxID=6337 RepID=A0A0V1IJ18_TRIPS|nr:hypothetical protein T4B_8958 [Trichinella pseudospiralis]